MPCGVGFANDNRNPLKWNISIEHLMAKKKNTGYIRWEEGGAPQEQVLKPTQNYTIGRSIQNEITIVDPKISRQHAKISWEGDGYVIEDLSSSNGTFVNGQRISDRHPLAHGDVLALHKRTLVFEMESEPPDDDPLNNTVSADATLFAVDLPASKGGAAMLFVETGPDQGKEFPIDQGSVTLGRTSRKATWEIRMSDRSVSRPHARVERQETGEYTIQDLGSANGTRVNGSPVGEAPVQLANGDLIELGESRLIFRVAE